MMIPKQQKMYDLDAFDASMFQEAQDVMKDRFPDLVGAYFEEAQEYIDKIKEGLKANNKIMVAQYAHPLKSSSAGLGIMSVSMIAEDIECQAKEAISKEQDIKGLDSFIVPIEESFQRAYKRIYLS